MDLKQHYDLVVIGGGIYGCGVTQAAAAAGYSVLLLEKKDWASGTSSKSSKLIHGGLRYLESAQFSLVAECLRERETLLQIAPDLVRPVPFYIPVYKNTSRSRWQFYVGLSLYQILARRSKLRHFQRLKDADMKDLQGLRQDELRAVFRYWDAQTDDRLLTLAVLESARSLSADTLSPAHFIAATPADEGFVLQLAGNEQSYTVSCKTIVNAAGPWINEVQRHLGPGCSTLPIDLVRGSHIIVEGLHAEHIFYLEAPSDRRAVFVMPWGNNTLIGTTECIHTGSPDEVSASEQEILYLQQVYQYYFPSHPRRLLDSFAGLRVLPKQEGLAFHRSRETILHCDDPARPTRIAIYGGKLTSYRAESEKVIRRLAPLLGERARRGDTSKLALKRPI